MKRKIEETEENIQETNDTEKTVRWNFLKVFFPYGKDCLVYGFPRGL